MNILLISDTHGKHRQLTSLPKAETVDMVIHAGDISTMGYINEIKDFLNWYASLPYQYKIFISGNHDFSFEDGFRKNKVRELLAHHPDIIYLEDEEVTIQGVQIYGSPWTPRFYDWAFNVDRGEPIAKKWAQIPFGTDILITHGPPYGVGDRCADGFRAGCKDLLERIEKVKPKLVIYGHIHEGYGMYSINKDTTGINCSVLDAQYFQTQDPVIINYYDFV